jgi:hypothetical protein
LDFRGLAAFQELLAHKVHRVQKAQKAHRVQKAHRDLQEQPALMVFKGLKVQLAQLVALVQTTLYFLLVHHLLQLALLILLEVQQSV